MAITCAWALSSRKEPGAAAVQAERENKDGPRAGGYQLERSLSVAASGAASVWSGNMSDS